MSGICPLIVFVSCVCVVCLQQVQTACRHEDKLKATSLQQVSTDYGGSGRWTESWNIKSAS